MGVLLTISHTPSLSVEPHILIHETSQSSDSFTNVAQVIATGTKLTPPSSLPGSEKPDGVTYLQSHVQKVVKSSKIAIIGGGAVGVQLATDIKELYPDKSVVLVHSRAQLMNKFHQKLHDVVAERCTELGIDMRLGSRVTVPPSGYPTDGSEFHVELEDGSKIPADFAVRLVSCYDQIPYLLLTQCPPDHLHRHDAAIKPASVSVTRVHRQRQLHPNVENFADR